MAEEIRRIVVWNGWLRLAHWGLAVATLALLVTGWLIGSAPTLAQAAADYHYLAAGLLLFALALRLWLGVRGRGAERFSHMLPTVTDLPGIKASLLFYLSLGRAPMPRWYAHNPLWKPIYLMLFGVLGLAALSGWLMPDRPLLAGVYLPRLHAWLADAVGVFVLLHVLSVVLQDWRGRSTDISAMLNGERYFHVDREGLIRPDTSQVSVRLDGLTPRGGSERDG